jgi:hypothetical protein
MKFKTMLIKMRACNDAIDWVGNKSIKQAWEECERADWMLWYLSKTIDRKRVVYLAALCAETVVDIYEKKYPNDSRVRDCIQACKDWSNNKISLDELEKYRNAAARAAAARADAFAAFAAAFVASAAADADDNDAFAATAAASAAASAADAFAVAADADREKHEKKMCDIIRKNIELKEIIKKRGDRE